MNFKTALLTTLATSLLSLTPALAAPSETTPSKIYDWRWVHGTVFVPTNCVNEAQQWDQYDPAINDRELHAASIYGINLVRVFLHYDIYLKNKPALLAHIDDFLTRANAYHIQTEFVFFDDCWNQPPADILSPHYQYPAPLFGVHNSQWLVSPGENIRKNYAANQPQLQAYVQDIVNAHLSDNRIAFWEIYNEPNHSPETLRLGKDAYTWIKEVGTTIPVTATGGEFSGDQFADFKSWHSYTADTPIRGNPIEALNTECMNRQNQSIPKIIHAYKGKTGFILWEYGIGRDNCRFRWDQERKKPATAENDTPFHGLVYPDAHPWSIADIKAFMGSAAFNKTPFFQVQYFKDDHFQQLAKTSIAPFIDFDLGHEEGTGSPDASANIPNTHFSIRWTGTFTPTDSPLTLHADGDGSIKITLNNKTFLNKTRPRPHQNFCPGHSRKRNARRPHHRILPRHRRRLPPHHLHHPRRHPTPPHVQPLLI